MPGCASRTFFYCEIKNGYIINMEQSNEEQQPLLASAGQAPQAPAGEVPSLSAEEEQIMVEGLMDELHGVSTKNPMRRRIADKVRSTAGGAFAQGANAMTAVYSNPLVDRVSQGATAVRAGMAGMMRRRQGQRQAAPAPEEIDPEVAAEIEAARAEYIKVGMPSARAFVVANEDRMRHGREKQRYVDMIRGEADPQLKEQMMAVFQTPALEARRKEAVATKRMNKKKDEAALMRLLAETSNVPGYLDPALYSHILEYVPEKWTPKPKK